MNKLLILAAFVVGCGGGAAPTETKPAEPAAPAPEAAPAAPAAPVMDGKAIYEQNCQTCHQADGTGAVNGQSIAGNYAERLGKTDEELFNSIKNGFTGQIGSMPAWGGTLNDDQIKAVLGYVRATYGGGAAPAAPAAPAEGAASGS